MCGERGASAHASRAPPGINQQNYLGAARRSGTTPDKFRAAVSALAATDRVASETARLNDWLDAQYEQELDFSPLEKTTLGRKDDYDKIDDFSEQGALQRLEWTIAKTVRIEYASVRTAGSIDVSAREEIA